MKANVRYSHDPKYKEPPRQVRLGITVIDLPDAETQRQGFYSAHAKRLAKNTKQYKLIVKKGHKPCL